MCKKYSHFIVIFLTVTLSYSQKDAKKYNADDLTRLTFGVHKSYYKKATVYRVNPETNNIGGFDLSNSQGYFINYKVLKHRNHSLKAGLFLNSLQHELWYKGNVTDVMTGNMTEVSSRPDPFVEKMLSLEYCLDYSYLLKINKKWFLDLSIGISQERNQSYENYSSTLYFSDFDLVPYQNPARSIYNYESQFMRTNYAAAIGYKIDAGMINLGVKYSVPNNTLVARGQYEFFEPGVSDLNQGYGFVKFSGDYLSVTLSFTPSKNIFKKK